ncbi:MAG: tRNA (adenosine(37)-N6)-threonylcarbamoyltransferase complex ATPase subunit type 1 TsaE [Deltaproteobacteria bacterium]|nr:tRNA (adenosine(37)-N6)-threonylcarbamoyltransferase complex ATPase subunit type 1 TsaE [Deltaproteobacteria bacterium]MBW1965729.1 tRNA (adenosine(37)-N6)-threonylcarbamoyltransferase complex ATPase subunit type 1 TsaE [Deltaproteobacteria bacterium]
MRLQYTLKGIEATNVLGNCLSMVLEPGDLFLLSGELGAGKTSLTKAIASGLGIEEKEVTSPSFTIIHEHMNGRLPLIHVDLYRLGPHADITEIGLEDYLDGENIVIIEWAEYLKDTLVETALKIDLSFVDEQSREVCMTGKTGIWRERLLVVDDCMKAYNERLNRKE